MLKLICWCLKYIYSSSRIYEVLISGSQTIHFLSIQPDDIDILNIGVTSSPFSVADNAQAGIFGWGKGSTFYSFTSNLIWVFR